MLDTSPPALLLGIGNILLSDDGVGVHVVRALEALAQRGQLPHPVVLRDGGTIGLALLGELENCRALIAVDAAAMDEEPGTVRVFEGAAMDRQLGGKKRSAHEVALYDLVMAAELAGCAPPRRALIGIQPASTQWGLSPTPEVASAIPTAVAAVLDRLAEWNDGL